MEERRLRHFPWVTSHASIGSTSRFTGETLHERRAAPVVFFSEDGCDASALGRSSKCGSLRRNRSGGFTSIKPAKRDLRRESMELRHMLRGEFWNSGMEENNFSAAVEQMRHVHSLTKKSRTHDTPVLKRTNLKKWVSPAMGGSSKKRILTPAGSAKPSKPACNQKRKFGESPRKGFTFRSASPPVESSTKPRKAKVPSTPRWVPNSAHGAKRDIRIRYFIDSPDEAAMAAEKAYTEARSRSNYARLTSRLQVDWKAQREHRLQKQTQEHDEIVEKGPGERQLKPNGKVSDGK